MSTPGDLPKRVESQCLCGVGAGVGTVVYLYTPFSAL